MLQDGEMGGDCGLGEAGGVADFAGADAEIVGMVLVGEVLFGVFELGEDSAAHRVGEGFQGFVQVGDGGLHRHETIYVSAMGDGQCCGAALLHGCHSFQGLMRVRP